MIVFPLQSAFLALPLEGDAKKQFQAFQEKILEQEGIFSFQDPASPHLTLQFWPSLMEIEYNQILAQALVLAEKSEPFAIKIEGADTFGQRGNDRVLFLNVPFSEPFTRLRKLCPWPSETPFHPHITLARISHPERFVRIKKQVMKLLERASFEMDVTMLRLYADVDDRTQTPLRDFPFAKI